MTDPRLNALIFWVITAATSPLAIASSQPPSGPKSSYPSDETTFGVRSNRIHGKKLLGGWAGVVSSLPVSGGIVSVLDSKGRDITARLTGLPRPSSCSASAKIRKARCTAPDGRFFLPLRHDVQLPYTIKVSNGRIDDRKIRGDLTLTVNSDPGNSVKTLYGAWWRYHSLNLTTSVARTLNLAGLSPRSAHGKIRDALNLPDSIDLEYTLRRRDSGLDRTVMLQAIGSDLNALVAELAQDSKTNKRSRLAAPTVVAISSASQRPLTSTVNSDPFVKTSSTGSILSAIAQGLGTGALSWVGGQAMSWVASALGLGGPSQTDIQNEVQNVLSDLTNIQGDISNISSQITGMESTVASDFQTVLKAIAHEQNVVDCDTTTGQFYTITTSLLSKMGSINSAMNYLNDLAISVPGSGLALMDATNFVGAAKQASDTDISSFWTVVTGSGIGVDFPSLASQKLTQCMIAGLHPLGTSVEWNGLNNIFDWIMQQAVAQTIIVSNYLTYIGTTQTPAITPTDIQQLITTQLQQFIAAYTVPLSKARPQTLYPDTFVDIRSGLMWTGLPGLFGARDASGWPGTFTPSTQQIFVPLDIQQMSGWGLATMPQAQALLADVPSSTLPLDWLASQTAENKLDDGTAHPLFPYTSESWIPQTNEDFCNQVFASTCDGETYHPNSIWPSSVTGPRGWADANHATTVLSIITAPLQTGNVSECNFPAAGSVDVNGNLTCSDLYFGTYQYGVLPHYDVLTLDGTQDICSLPEAKNNYSMIGNPCTGVEGVAYHYMWNWIEPSISVELWDGSNTLMTPNFNCQYALLTNPNWIFRCNTTIDIPRSAYPGNSQLALPTPLVRQPDGTEHYFTIPKWVN